MHRSLWWVLQVACERAEGQGSERAMARARNGRPQREQSFSDAVSPQWNQLRGKQRPAEQNPESRIAKALLWSLNYSPR
jgi:hypothetical protein